jgi:hypothetical protein
MKRISTTTRRWFSGAAAAVVALAIAGCGPDRPSLVPATGTVTLSGKPQEGVDVMFVSKTGRPARGKTDAAGRFTLGTFEATDGAIVGEYTVAFSQMVRVETGATGQDPANAHSAAAATREKLRGACTSPMSSPFKATVAAGEKNDFTFDLAKPGT